MRLLNLLLAATLAVLAATATARDPVLAVPDADQARGDLATLVLPESLDIEMLDGIVYPGFKSMFRKGELELRVLPGEREVAVKYNQLFNVTADMHEVVKSKILVLTFVAEPGKRYRAQHAKFRNVDEARAGTKNFVVTVIDEQGVNRVTAASQVQKNWKGESTTTSRKDLVNPEAVVAVVQPAGSFDADAVREEMRRDLAAFKVPKQIIVLDELPRNTMGKIQKKLLREKYADLFA